MVYIIFLVSSALLVLAAVKLAEYADAISLRTGLGRLFIGTLLLAGGTSLPEFLTIITSLQNAAPNLAAGNIFGSNMFNVVLLGLLDLAYWRSSILAQVANKHVMTAGFCVLLSGVAIFFVQAGLPLRIGWIGLDSLVLIALYVGTVYLLHANSVDAGPSAEELAAAKVPPLWTGLVGFSLSVALLILVTPRMVDSAIELAHITGLGTGFVGTTLVSVITSIPELVTCIVAIRLQAYDLAVGNLFGSIMFNLFSLGVTDLFYTKGLFLTDIDPVFGLVGLLSLILVSIALLSNAITRRRFHRSHIDAWLIVVTYVLGIYFIYQRGLAG
ncbi:MAG: sodium:calcium antiporter [Anaerolineae bacterium]